MKHMVQAQAHMTFVQTFSILPNFFPCHLEEIQRFLKLITHRLITKFCYQGSYHMCLVYPQPPCPEIRVQWGDSAAHFFLFL